MTACAPLASDYRKESFKLMQQYFDAFDAPSDVNMVLELKNVRVYIVSDRKYFKWDKAYAANSGVVGYATSGNEIYVFGKRLGNKIIVNQAVLGHEFNHLLNFKDIRVANPDKLDDLELCFSNGFGGVEC